ncbi:RidA family protein [Mangrovicoccus sp. HB161399]|uniref:RidA family protein n=1 Tax=Mangrovicoccus sp. HB161399 TaxID=2720392 RepID=UPI0015554355|nr:RidA family protein [Mangrovicoccus sp. HB161399]
MSVQPVTAPGLPAPQGHYAHGTIGPGGPLIFVSGQLPRQPDGAHGPDAPFAAQVRQCLENLLAIVGADGGSRDSLLRVTAYIAGVEHWPAFDAVYAEVMGPARPARTVVPVQELHHGYLVEVDAIALQLAQPAGDGAQP